MRQRAARISGWIGISWVSKGKQEPWVGGLVNISKSGARLYLNWRCEEGNRIPLAIRLKDGEVVEMPARVVWVQKDEPGKMEAFDARINLLQEILRRGGEVKGVPYGFLHGVKFDANIKQGAVRMIQQHLEKQREDRRERAAMRFKVASKPMRPLESEGPATGWFKR